jgi:hypothetical protein
MIRSELAHLELLAEVDALVDRLRRWAEEAPAWQPAEKCRALVRRLADRAVSLRVRIEAPLVVATLGGTGTGKSALVNALLGSEVVQTGRRRPTTTRPTIVCRSGLTPEMLGIDPASVELVQCELPALRDLVLVDCPDPDTTEEDFVGGDSSRRLAEGGDSVGCVLARTQIPDPTVSVRASTHPTDALAPLSDSNLARLRAILPKCDVLLVAATQQKYRSARVAEELAAASRGAHVVFVQTHADEDADIRDDWRGVLGEGGSTTATPTNTPTKFGRIFFVDSLRALCDARAGLQPRGEFAALLDLLTHQMAATAAHRIRRANFLDLVAETLDACGMRIDEALPAVGQLRTALEEQRGLLAGELARQMRSELLASRRQWESRLLAQTASRWGFSPFALLLRAYQGIGGLATGALLYRVRTPAQAALWGALEGTRAWRKRRQQQQAGRGIGRAAAGCWDTAELHKAALIVDGYAAEAGLGRPTPEHLTVEAETAAAGFVARVSAELDSLIARLAQRHTGWFTRWRYELLLAVMLGLLLYRLGKNFFYDSWLAEQPAQVFGLEFYLSAAFWLLLWCLLLMWAFCSRLRRGLRGEIDRLAEGWRDQASAAGLFAHLETDCRRIEQFRQELDGIRQHVDSLRRQLERG